MTFLSFITHSNFSAKTALLKTKLTVQINGYLRYYIVKFCILNAILNFKPFVFVILTLTPFVYFLVAQSGIAEKIHVNQCEPRADTAMF